MSSILENALSRFGGRVGREVMFYGIVGALSDDAPDTFHRMLMVANMHALNHALNTGGLEEIDIEGAIGLSGPDEDTASDRLEQFADLMTTMQELRMVITERYGEETLLHRIGNEAVLSMDDLLPA